METKKDEIRALTLRLRPPGLDLDPDKTWSILGMIAEKYPELDQYSTDEKESRFKIAKKDSKNDELQHVAISKDVISIVRMEIITFSEWRHFSLPIFETIIDNIKISPLSVVYLDNQYHTKWTTNVHHGQMIYELFGRSTGMNNLLGNSRVAQFNPKITFVLDQPEQIICAITISNNSPVSADILPDYSESYESIATCGIVKLGNYKPFTDLKEVINKILELSEEFHCKRIDKYLFTPIDRFIKSKSEKQEK